MFKSPSGTPYPYVTIHLIRTTLLHLMGIPTSEVSYTSATAGRGDHVVHKGHVVGALENNKQHKYQLMAVQTERFNEFL
jgi:hypothetical protein